MKNVACRVAFAAFLHNLGELAEYARMEATDDASHPHPHDDHRINHPEIPPNDHTTLAWDALKQHLPDLVRDDLAPFASRTATQHHPDTFLQEIIVTADRVAAGFAGDAFAQDDTPYHYRLLTLFEQIGLGDNPKDKTRDQLHYRYPLRPLNPHSIYPEKRENGEPADNAAAQVEYRALWQQFQHDLQHIPAAHRSNWPLWLDHFDTL